MDLFYTMLRKDVVRMFRIWVQTFLPSVITSCLYFLIFGTVLGSRIGEMQGVDYMSFVVPGLVMLAIVTNAYSNTSFTFFQSKFFFRGIDEILVSPTPPWLLSWDSYPRHQRGVLVGAIALVSAFTGFLPLQRPYHLRLLTAHGFACGARQRRLCKSLDAVTSYQHSF
jgi:ABC-2 type transport system permease protein